MFLGSLRSPGTAKEFSPAGSMTSAGGRVVITSETILFPIEAADIMTMSVSIVIDNHAVGTYTWCLVSRGWNAIPRLFSPPTIFHDAINCQIKIVSGGASTLSV